MSDTMSPTDRCDRIIELADMALECLTRAAAPPAILSGGALPPPLPRTTDIDDREAHARLKQLVEGD